MYPVHCPVCGAFVSIQPFIDLVSDVVSCRSCSHRIHVPSVFDVALASGTRRAETDMLYRQAQGVACQSGPQGNAQYSNLQPNGKIKKTLGHKTDKNLSGQLDLFGGVQ